jgi:hypothetical protein
VSFAKPLGRCGKINIANLGEKYAVKNMDPKTKYLLFFAQIWCQLGKQIAAGFPRNAIERICKNVNV